MKCVLEIKTQVSMSRSIGGGGGEKPFMTYQLDKQKNTVLINVGTKASAASVGSFALDKITEDFIQTETTKFFTRVASEIG